MRSLTRFVRSSALVAMVVLAAPSMAAAPAPERHQEVVSHVVALALENFHLAGRPIDAKVADAWMDAYLDQLDPERFFFTASDIKAMKLMSMDMGAGIRRFPADVSPAFTVHARFTQRVQERVAFAQKMLSKEVSLDHGDLAWQRDREKGAWEPDSAALDVLWTHRIIDQLILRSLADEDPTAAREALAKRYKRLGEDIGDYDANDVLESWLGALGSVYDPHTMWFKPAAKDDFDIQMTDRLEGIGATLRTEGEYTRVVSLVPGGPADMGGELKPDDRILAVAQKGDAPVDIVGMRIDRVVKLIRGAKGTDVVLTVIPADAPSDDTVKDIRITRDEVVIEAASAKLEVKAVGGKKVAVIDVPSFYQDVRRNGRSYEVIRSTSVDVRKLLTELGPNGADAVVLDLRMNTGGALTQAIELTGLFIDRGPVVQIQGKRDPSRRPEVLEDQDAGMAWSGPLVVLTSPYSASASEIVAAALQDYGRALIVGSPSTHGKGTVQELLDLQPLIARFGVVGDQDAGALKYTTSQFYRINGKSTQRVGVVPDVVVPGPFDGLDQREGDLDNALPYDEITASRFQTVGDIRSRVPKLQSASAKRISASAGFQAMAELKATRDARDGKPTSLDLARRRAERDEWKALEDKAEKAGLNEDQDLVLDETLAIVVDFLAR